MLRGLTPLLMIALVAFSAPLFGQDPNYTLRIESDVTEVFVGGTFDVQFRLDAADGEPMQGYQWGVCQDDNLAELVDGDIVNGTTVDATSHTFLSVSVLEGGWTVGALTNVISMTTLPAEDDLQMFDGTYTAGDTIGDTTLEWCETLGGAQLVTVRVIVTNEEIEPTVEDLTISIVEEPEIPTLISLLDAQDATITINSTGSTVGPALVNVDLTNTDEDAPFEVGAFSFGLTHDADLLDLTSITLGSIVTGSNGGSGPDFDVTNIDPAGGAGGFVAVVISLNPESAPFDVIPEGADQQVATFSYSAGPELTETDTPLVEFSGGLGNPPVAIALSVDGVTRVPDTDPATITVEVSEIATNDFIRGDANNSGAAEFTDVFFILEFVFLAGEEPICRLSADFNGTSTIDITDATNMLDWIFLAGDPPPAPFPDCDTGEVDPATGEGCAESHDACL